MKIDEISRDTCDFGPYTTQFSRADAALPKGHALHLAVGGQYGGLSINICSITLGLHCGCIGAGMLDGTGPKSTNLLLLLSPVMVAQKIHYYQALQSLQFKWPELCAPTNSPPRLYQNKRS